MSKDILVGIVGAGRIGCVHAQTMHTMVSGVRVGAVCSASGDSAKKLAEDFGIPKYGNDYRELCTNPDLDAIAICSATETHLEIIVAAARAGKHIFCEKPLALDIHAIDRALKVVADSGVHFMLGFNHRHDAGVMGVRKAIEQGVIGKPEMVFLTGRDPSLQPLSYLETSGGIFLDTVVHDFDVSRYLLADEPEEIYARGECNVDTAIAGFGDYDTVMAIARFRSGVLVHYNNSRRAVYGFDQRVEVLGPKGRLETSNIHENNITFAAVDGYHRAPIKNFFMDRYMEAYQYEGKVFAECIRDNRTPPCGARDGRQSVLMALAATKSAKENRPVRISEVDPAR